MAGAEAAILVKGKEPEGTRELFLSSPDACLPPKASLELWRLLRQRRTPLASQLRVDAVTMWKKRNGSAGWWRQQGRGSVVNTLESRRSGISLPSPKSEISFLVRHLPSDRFLLLLPGFSSFSCNKRSPTLPGDEP